MNFSLATIKNPEYSRNAAQDQLDALIGGGHPQAVRTMVEVANALNADGNYTADVTPALALRQNTISATS